MLNGVVTTACTVCVVVLEKILLPALKRARMHPADLRVQIGTCARQALRVHEGLPANIDIVLEHQGHRLGLKLPCNGPSRVRFL